MSGKGAKGLSGKGAKGTITGEKKGDKKKPISRSARAGLQFPVGRIHRLLKVSRLPAKRTALGAAVSRASQRKGLQEGAPHSCGSYRRSGHAPQRQPAAAAQYIYVPAVSTLGHVCSPRPDRPT